MNEDLESEYQKTMQLLKELGRNNNVRIVEGKPAQQSMHPTSGIRRGLLARFWLRVLSPLKHLSTPPTRG